MSLVSKLGIKFLSLSFDSSLVWPGQPGGNCGNKAGCKHVASPGLHSLKDETVPGAGIANLVLLEGN